MVSSTENLIEEFLIAVENSDVARFRKMMANESDARSVIGHMALDEQEHAKHLEQTSAKQNRIIQNQLASFNDVCELVKSANIDWSEISYRNVQIKEQDLNGVTSHRLNFEFGTVKWRFSVCIQSLIEVEKQFKLFSAVQSSCKALDKRNPEPDSLVTGQFRVIEWAELMDIETMSARYFYFENKYRNRKVAYAEGFIEMTSIHLDEPFFGCAAIVVNGTLHVHENVVNENMNIGNLLYVTGDLKAKQLIAGGAEIHVDGTSHIEQAVFAHGNDGVLILNELITELVIDDDHHTEIEIERGIKRNFSHARNYDALMEFLESEPAPSESSYSTWLAAKDRYS